MSLENIVAILKAVQDGSGGGGEEGEGSLVQEAFHQHGGDEDEEYEDTCQSKKHDNYL